jgi:uncharacterized caspase-like protein
MKKITMFLTSLIVCSSSVLASLDGAKVISTKELVGVCTDQSSAQQQVYCDVYGQGVYDSYLVTRHPKNAHEFICVAQPAPTRHDVMNQFTDWVRQNPRFNNDPAADTLLRFLAFRFPCASSNMSPENTFNQIIR